MAVPPSSPWYHACRMALAFCFAQLRAIALPLITTTTRGLPLPFTASRSLCSSRGRSRLVRFLALEFSLHAVLLALEIGGDAHDGDHDVGLPGRGDGTGLRVRLRRHPDEARGRERGIDSIRMAIRRPSQRDVDDVCRRRACPSGPPASRRRGTVRCRGSLDAEPASRSAGVRKPVQRVGRGRAAPHRSSAVTWTGRVRRGPASPAASSGAPASPAVEIAFRPGRQRRCSAPTSARARRAEGRWRRARRRRAPSDPASASGRGAVVERDGQPSGSRPVACGRCWQAVRRRQCVPGSWRTEHAVASTAPSTRGRASARARGARGCRAPVRHLRRFHALERVEEAQLEARAQHALQGHVDLGFGQQPCFAASM